LTHYRAYRPQKPLLRGRARHRDPPGSGAAQVCTRATRTLTGWASRGPSTNPPFGQTGENSPSRDKLCLGGGPHADGACHCCSCVHRVRINRGRTRLVRVPAADGQRTSSVTSGGQLAVYRQEVRPFTDKQVALLKNFSVLISWAHKRKSLVEIGESSGWSLASTRSDLAVVTARAPVCADKFRALPDADAKKVTLSKWQIPHYGHLCTFRCARMLSGFQTYSMSVIVKKFCHQNI
jgi:hypothetical protein